tara:strand:- start:27 stop:527 length:501 start_codon:yes stop_codon:yes gene_type:complete
MSNKLTSLSERVECDYQKYKYGMCEAGALESIAGYNNFLKQPLTLGMFVPCDDEGNVLDDSFSGEPVLADYKIERFNTETGATYDDGYDYQEFELHNKYYEIYQQAEEKVLFKGFYIHHGELYYPNQVHFETALFGQDWFNIEHLLQNAYQPIKLTDYGAICAGIK